MWNIGAQKIIESRNITLRELVPVFDVSSVSAVAQYLRGEMQPKPSQLKALADYLDVRIDELFDDQNKINQLIERLASRENTLDVAYAWSTPTAVDDDALCYNVIQAGRFEDMLALSNRLGFESFAEAVSAHPADHFSEERNHIVKRIEALQATPFKSDKLT